VFDKGGNIVCNIKDMMHKVKLTDGNLDTESELLEIRQKVTAGPLCHIHNGGKVD
jgi:hypothetical protein